MCAASVNGSAAALRSGSVPAVTPSALHFFRRRPLTEASFQINSEHPARPCYGFNSHRISSQTGIITIRGFVPHCHRSLVPNYRALIIA
jgi:hypothetical protein